MNNCGGCGITCPAGDVCSGSCVLSCQTGLTNCSGVCANEQTDNHNCGACGNVCGAQQVCSAGACASECVAGQTLCPAVGANPAYCSNEQTDNHNCGACGNVCGAQQVCSAGVCTSECVAGQTLCPAVGANPAYCANEQTDVNNCGGCGTVCALTHATSYCLAGTCGIASCNTGWANCSGHASDGCNIASANGSCNYTIDLDVNPASAGWYYPTHDASNPNYILGEEGGNLFRDYFVFNLSPIPTNSTVTSVTFSAQNPCGGGTANLTWTLYLFPSAQIASLESSQTSAAVFAQLASGTVCAQSVVANVSATPETMPFTAAGLAAVQAALGGMIAFGGDYGAPAYPANSYILGCSTGGSGSSNVTLTINAVPR